MIQESAIQAAIHIGPSSISMLVSSNDQEAKEVDFLEQSNSLAHDIFSKGSVSKSTIEKTVTIITGYMDNLRELGFPKDQTPKIVASNIVSEASNSDILFNRIQISCSAPISLLDDGEMTRLIYLKTRRRLRDTPVMQTRTTLVIHVGPGNTRAIVFQEGRISSYSSYRLGTHRTAENVSSIESLTYSTSSSTKIIREQISNTVSAIKNDYAHYNIEELVCIGYEIQNLGSSLPSFHNNKVSLKSMKELAGDFSTSTTDKIVKKFSLAYHNVEPSISSVEINLMIAEAFGVKHFRLPGSDYEKGLLTDMLTRNDHLESFKNEVVSSAFALSERYHIHQEHAEQVSSLTEEIYQFLQPYHKLSNHDALLLKIAAILHECGGFISERAHHKHSHYIIKNSEVFGLSEEDVSIIALIARYHRNSPPKPSHADYRDLSSENKMRVSKLAAILRVADALDRTHSSRVQKIDLKIKSRKLYITLHGIQDASIERQAMKSKGNLLQDIYGLDIQITEDKQ